MEEFGVAGGTQSFTHLLEGQPWLYLLDDSPDEAPCQHDGGHCQHVEVYEVKVLWGQNQNYSVSISSSNPH